MAGPKHDAIADVCCPVCGAAVGAPFVDILDVPVQVNVLHRSADTAQAATRGDLRLCFCGECAFIWNVAFDAGLVEYDGDYENSLHHSPAFEAYATSLAERLDERYELAGKHVVEVGCGQAMFLRRLCETAGARGTGFDPSYVGPEQIGPVTVHRALYTEETVDNAAADFVLCQHVLEHIEEPLEFVRSLRRTFDAAAGTPVYFEVPNGEYQLENGVVWDMIYAHVSTFTEPSLRTLFELAGFNVLDMGTSFGGQYLWIEARPAEAVRRTETAPGVARVRALAERFASGYETAVGDWRARMASFAASGRNVVLWGAGAKGVSLLNALDSTADVSTVVDLNPRKHGAYIPGSGTPVVSPESLGETRPDIVVLANPIYGDEVRTILADLGQRAEVISA